MKFINKKAFSLIELSVVILIIGIIIAGVTQGSRLISAQRISSAQSLSKSSPVNSIPDLSLWLDSTSESSFKNLESSDSSTISEWNDVNPQKNFKNNALQSDSAKKPSYTSDAINGLPAVKFSGSQYIDIPYNVDLCGTEHTYFIVFKTVTLPTTLHAGIFSNRGEASSIKGIVLYITPYTYQVEGWIGTGSAWTGQNSTYANVVKRTELVTVTYKSPNYNIRFYRDSSKNTSETIVMAPQTSGQPFRFGASPNIMYPTPSAPTFFYNGYIGEFIYFNRKLNMEEVIAVETYLPKKWGIK